MREIENASASLSIVMNNNNNSDRVLAAPTDNSFIIMMKGSIDFVGWVILIKVCCDVDNDVTGGTDLIELMSNRVAIVFCEES
jgi:hypothetical protein